MLNIHEPVKPDISEEVTDLDLLFLNIEDEIAYLEHLVDKLRAQLLLRGVK